MNPSAKKRGAVLLLIAVMAAFVLTSAIGQLRLEPGNPFPAASGQSTEDVASGAARRLPAAEALPAVRGILALSILVLGILLIKRLVEVTRLDHILGFLIVVGAMIALLISLPRLPAGRAIELPPEAAAPSVPSIEHATSPLGTPPPSFFWIAGLLVLTSTAAALIIALRPQPRAVEMRDILAAEAGRAIQQIEAGANATSVVVRCYLRMTGLIQEERGLSRPRSMTVREFETDLRNLDLPPEPLLRLRGLFEAVRYGSRPMRTDEEQAASDALKAIVSFLKGEAV
ncbi:MAG TPA: DUF4129 domain-containing protein [Anaerolineales bacterium]|nr:DUF4129 domain-containing protein [Anaerolineales bacterium]